MDFIMTENLITAAEGGVCAAKGFVAGGIHCGLRKNAERLDLAMVRCENVCTAAGVYTTNLVKGAPLLVTREHISDGTAQAIVVNSGIANTCAPDGEEKANAMSEIAAKALGLKASDMIVASTGVIGPTLPLAPIEYGCPILAQKLTREGHIDAAHAIMTTDTQPKEAAVSVVIGGKTCTLGGMAKGSGMIHPNMATMLCFMTTDANITAAALQAALSAVTKDTFNMVSIDGDTSTNDMALILASGQAENALIDDTASPEFALFCKALFGLMRQLSRMIAGDGEGASKLLECTVTGARDEASAKLAAKSVITSSLFKSAMFGEDANWGRILCAIGYSGADLDVSGVEVTLASEHGSILVCRHGRGVDFSEEEASRILHADEIKILVSLSDGDAQAIAWGCDLTYDYVKINADYRS